MDEKLVKSFFVPLNSGFAMLSDTTNESVLDGEFISVLKSMLNAKEIETLSIKYDVFNNLLYYWYWSKENDTRLTKLQNT